MLEAFMQVHQALVRAGVDDPARDALHLVDILSQGAVRRLEVTVPADLDELAARRRDGTPLEYALGHATFMGLDLICTPDTLIPREETELLASVARTHVRELQQAAGTANASLTVADIGTGCGNLAIALAAQTQGTHVLASDLSPEAVEVARRNTRRHKLEDRVTLLCGDMLEPLFDADHADLDLVVCNPPYIPTTSLPKLAPEIREHEPVMALDAGAYGLAIFRKLITQAARALRPGGRLAFEIGAGQEKLVQRLLGQSDAYEAITEHEDADGHVRVLSAVRKSDDA